MSHIGLKRGMIKLSPHNPKWKSEYYKHEKILKRILSEFILDIQHIGSTAIEGIVAKPIIDIAIAV
jgi:GrpB-like predicted nucleotidyltransferase (UPF0157 family)